MTDKTPLSRADIVGLLGDRLGDNARAERSVAEVEYAAAEKAYERGRLDERHDCSLTSLYHGSVISAEQLQRDLRSRNPYRAAALGLTAEQEEDDDEQNG